MGQSRTPATIQKYDRYLTRMVRRNHALGAILFQLHFKRTTGTRVSDQTCNSTLSCGLKSLKIFDLCFVDRRRTYCPQNDEHRSISE
ncbi:hypothetical protein TNIN_446711 [Trichonephila inaurata madagascariensis]|uniref:Uncharacterized protein n=1 Tax=Trichonephila inaurata madagascariensis TaxID=2747483 RepID=A0A8X7CC52_9ARAC|nr:hypothetical protein TNIN_446711 [Trichonephila inaurata madagascariensis]